VKAGAVDFLKARVLELCDQAEASIAQLRKLDFSANDAAEFHKAYAV
jgi:hypothetical protein